MTDQVEDTTMSESQSKSAAIEELHQRIDDLEREVGQQSQAKAVKPVSGDSGPWVQDPPIGRRAAIGGMAGLVGLLLATGNALGQETIDPDLLGTACEWLGDQQAASYRLFNLGLLHNSTHDDANAVDSAAGSLAAVADSGEVKPFWDYGNGLEELSTGGGGGGGLTTAVIDDTDSPYTTSGEDVIYVNTANGAVSVVLASADATEGNEIRIVNIDGSNAVTVSTESTETIDPGAESSKTISNAGWGVAFVSDGSDWDSSLAAEYGSIDTGATTIGEGSTINQIEFGTGSIDPPGAASDDGWDTAEIVTDSVVFNEEFDNTPTVVSNFRSRPGLVLSLFDVSTTGFSIAIRNYSTTDLSGNTDPWWWVAFG